MTEGFQVQLSSGEIYTLASMLGFPSIIGIEENTLHSWGADLRRYVRMTVAKLERKKLIECGIQEELKILPELRAMISCLGAPEQVLLLSGNLNPERHSTIAVLKSASGTVKVCNLDTDTYKLQLFSAYDPTDIVSAFLNGTEAFSLEERMLIEDAEWIREKSLSFEQEKARRCLLSCIATVNVANDLLMVLSGQSKTLEIRMLHRENVYYANVSRIILAVTGKHAMTVKTDSYRMIHFNGVDPEKFLLSFQNSYFSFAKEYKADG